MITYNNKKLKQLLDRDYNGNKMLLRRTIGGNNETITRYINGEDIYIGKLVTICNRLGYDIEEFFIRDDESLLRLPVPAMKMPAEQATAGQEGWGADGQQGRHPSYAFAEAQRDSEREKNALLVQHARELAEVQVAERERECQRLREELEAVRERLLDAYQQIGLLKAQAMPLPSTSAHGVVNEKPASYATKTK